MISFYYKITEGGESATLINNIEQIQVDSNEIIIDGVTFQVSDAMLLIDMFATLSYKNSNTLIRYIDGNIDVVKYGSESINHSFSIDDVVADFIPEQIEKQKQKK